MQRFAALLASAFVAASGAFAEVPQKAVGDAAAVNEVYVAELDADWNVAREVRLPCSADTGCAVDLGGAGTKPLVHVRFDAVRGGSIAVSSSVVDASGRAVVQPAAVVTLDRTGFGAVHFDAAALAAGTGDGQRIIMMAVKAPGWLAPQSSAPIGGTRI